MLDRLLELNATALQPNFPPLDPESAPKYHNGTWGPWVNTTAAIADPENPLGIVVKFIDLISEGFGTWFDI